MSDAIHNTLRVDYRGARVLVTGGTSGIGAGIANAYRDAGAQVTITGTRPATCSSTQRVMISRSSSLSRNCSE